MYFRYFLIIFPWKRVEQTWIPITQGYFVPSLVEIGPVVLKKKIFKFPKCNFAISFFYLTLGPSFELTWIPFTQGCFVLSLVEIGSVVLEKRFFVISSMYFRYFCKILPLEMSWVLHLNKREPHSHKNPLCQVLLKWAQWFWRI